MQKFAKSSIAPIDADLEQNGRKYLPQQKNKSSFLSLNDLQETTRDSFLQLTTKANNFFFQQEQKKETGIHEYYPKPQSQQNQFQDAAERQKPKQASSTDRQQIPSPSQSTSTYSQQYKNGYIIPQFGFSLHKVKTKSDFNSAQCKSKFYEKQKSNQAKTQIIQDFKHKPQVSRILEIVKNKVQGPRIENAFKDISKTTTTSSRKIMSPPPVHMLECHAGVKQFKGTQVPLKIQTAQEKSILLYNRLQTQLDNRNFANGLKSVTKIKGKPKKIHIEKTLPAYAVNNKNYLENTQIKPQTLSQML